MYARRLEVLLQRKRPDQTLLVLWPLLSAVPKRHLADRLLFHLRSAQCRANLLRLPLRLSRVQRRQANQRRVPRPPFAHPSANHHHHNLLAKVHHQLNDHPLVKVPRQRNGHLSVKERLVRQLVKARLVLPQLAHQGQVMSVLWLPLLPAPECHQPRSGHRSVRHHQELAKVRHRLNDNRSVKLLQDNLLAKVHHLHHGRPSVKGHLVVRVRRQRNGHPSIKLRQDNLLAKVSRRRNDRRAVKGHLAARARHLHNGLPSVKDLQELVKAHRRHSVLPLLINQVRHQALLVDPSKPHRHCYRNKIRPQGFHRLRRNNNVLPCSNFNRAHRQVLLEVRFKPRLHCSRKIQPYHSNNDLLCNNPNRMHRGVPWEDLFKRHLPCNYRIKDSHQLHLSSNVHPYHPGLGNLQARPKITSDREYQHRQSIKPSKSLVHRHTWHSNRRSKRKGHRYPNSSQDSRLHIHHLKIALPSKSHCRKRRSLTTHSRKTYHRFSSRSIHNSPINSNPTTSSKHHITHSNSSNILPVRWFLPVKRGNRK